MQKDRAIENGIFINQFSGFLEKDYLSQLKRPGL